MSTVFNPYKEWLGLDESVGEPNYFQLLQINPTEADESVIAQAADQAVAAVRICKPGEHAASWAQVLDLLKEAKSCLLDPAKRQAYQQQLQQVPAAAPQPAPVPQPASEAPSDLLPPGMGGAPIGTPTPTVQQPQTPAVDPSMMPPGAGGVPVLEAGTPAPLDQPAAIPVTPQPTAIPTPQPMATPVAQPQYTDLSPAASAALPPQSVAVPPAPASFQPTAPQYQPQPTPGMIDPMAPVAAAGAPVPQAYAPQAPMATPAAMPVDPMAPVGADPMAPVGADPMAPVGANPMAPAVASPIGADPGFGGTGRLVAGNATNEPKPQVESKSSPAAMANQRRKSAMQTPMIITIGLALFGLFAGAAYMAMQMTQDPEVASNDGTDASGPDGNNPPSQTAKSRNVAKNDDSNNGNSGLRPRADTTVSIEPPTKPPERSTPMPVDPMPKPVDPMPVPKPVDPVPTPMPPPVPPMPEPVPVVKPTPAEVAALETALKTARQALFEKNIDVAEAELLKAAPLAKLPAHKAKLERLQMVTKLLHQFWDAVVEGTKKLTGGDVLETKGNAVAIVEASPDLIIYRFAGTNFRRPPRQLGDGLAIVISNMVLPKDDPQTYLMHGALFAINIEKNPDYKADASRLWQQASAAGVEDAENLIEYLSDEYELMKDLEE